MSDKYYYNNEFIKYIRNLFIKYWKELLACFTFFLILFYFIWQYPPLDAFIIAINMGFLAFVFAKIVKNPECLNSEAKVTLVIGILALQAAWPIFMPRISLENLNQETGIIEADKPSQIFQEAIVKVKPPLFPFIMERNYPIANHLTQIYYDYSSPNLNISDNFDGRNINIKLNHVTGWSFDEISGRIKYAADQPLPYSIPSGDKNISRIYTIPKFQKYELFPYDYGYSSPIPNPNNFPILGYNISFLIYNNTEAWIDLKKWIDSGYCVYPIYSWSNGSSASAEVNGEQTLISRKMFSSSNISLQIPYIRLSPHETKSVDIIFKETVCVAAVKDNSSYTSYNISGMIKVDRETPFIQNANYFIILIRNINTNENGTTYAFPNAQYKYDLASLPGGYAQGDVVQINLCENVQNCTVSKNITVDMMKGYDEVNLPYP